MFTVEPFAQREHLLAVRDESSEKLAVHFSPAEFRTRGQTGHESGDRCARIRHRVAEQEAAQTLPPRVFGGFRQSFTDPVRFVHPPAYAGLPHHAANDGEIGLTNSEANPDRRCSQRRQDRLGAKS